MLFPSILILLTKYFSPSFILNFKFILFSTICSSTVDSIDLDSSLRTISSISSKIFSIMYSEYVSPFKSFNKSFKSEKFFVSKSSGKFNNKLSNIYF